MSNIFEHIRRLLKNNHSHLFLVVVFRAIGASSSILLTAIVSLNLTTTLSGNFFFAYSLVMLIASINGMGLESSILRFIGAHYLSKEYKIVNQIYKFSISVTFKSSIIFTLAFLTIIYSYYEYKKEGTDLIYLVVIAPAIFLITYSNINASAMQAVNESIKSIFTFNILTPAIFMASILLIKPNQLVEYSLIFVIAAAINSIISYTIWSRKPFYQWSKVIPKPIWGTAVPLWIVVITTQSVTWGGQIILGFTSVPDDIAIFTISQRVASLISFLLVSLNVVIAPKFAHYYHTKNFEGLEKLAKKVTLSLILTALPIGLCIIFGSNSIMNVFGDIYLNNSHVLKILAIGHMVNAISGPCGYILMMSGNEKDVKNTSIITCLIFIISSLILSNYYGATGCAIAFCISYTLPNIAALFFIKKRLGFFLLNVFALNKEPK